MNNSYNTKEEVLEQSKIILKKTLRDIIPFSELNNIESDILKYDNRRKGLLGDFVEKYVFGKKPDGLSQADFLIAGVELKTTPIKKHPKLEYSSKERLVFSMINYTEIVKETWKESSFLKKNKVLLLMFYLWVQGKSILDYEFKFIHLLDLVEDVSAEDALQIQRDWEFIVNKIKRGEAHLLSEGDTYYLGACTKASNSKVVREQVSGYVPAKPRAFSLKQQYINYLIQTKLLGHKSNTDSLFKKHKKIETIEDVVRHKFDGFIGRTDKEIIEILGISFKSVAKNYKRLLTQKILGVSTGNIEELEKANITLKVITLEPSGVLKESVSFPAFKYTELVDELWNDEDSETMTDFHLQLETKKFLFIVFQKQKNSTEILLKKTFFWNFPMKDLAEAEKVWTKTVECIRDGRYNELPKISDSYVAHVRPHGKNGSDKIETPQKTMEMRRCFWLNAKYIQNAIENYKD